MRPGWDLSRRALFAAGAGVGVAALASAAPARAAMERGPDAINLRPDGTYEVVPLVKPNLSLGIVQSRVRPIDATSDRVAQRGRRENLDHMLNLIDAAQAYGGRRDLLFFHEFPLTGWSYEWDRTQALRAAIELPGPESEEIARKARQYGCWIVFGSYVRDRDWPGHLLSITTLIDSNGRIVDKHWKARNIIGVFQGFELFTTTIHNVFDRYVEMYGRDAVVPVTRTPLGNLGTTSTQREPEYLRAMAMKGAEIILRTATGGFTPLDIQATSFYNGVYTAIVNNSISPGIGKFFEAAGGGGSALYGPRGEVVAQAQTQAEELVGATIPIAQFRERHRQPNVHMDLVLAEFSRYRSRHAPNLFWPQSPSDGQDAMRFLADKARWK
jgi:predicted amidohydrolase